MEMKDRQAMVALSIIGSLAKQWSEWMVTGEATADNLPVFINQVDEQMQYVRIAAGTVKVS